MPASLIPRSEEMLPCRPPSSQKILSAHENASLEAPMPLVLHSTSSKQDSPITHVCAKPPLVVTASATHVSTFLLLENQDQLCKVDSHWDLPDGCGLIDIALSPDAATVAVIFQIDETAAVTLLDSTSLQILICVSLPASFCIPSDDSLSGPALAFITTPEKLLSVDPTALLSAQTQALMRAHSQSRKNITHTPLVTAAPAPYALTVSGTESTHAALYLFNKSYSRVFKLATLPFPYTMQSLPVLNTAIQENGLDVALTMFQGSKQLYLFPLFAPMTEKVHLVTVPDFPILKPLILSQESEKKPPPSLVALVQISSARVAIASYSTQSVSITPLEHVKPAHVDSLKLMPAAEKHMMHIIYVTHSKAYPVATLGMSRGMQFVVTAHHHHQSVFHTDHGGTKPIAIASFGKHVLSFLRDGSRVMVNFHTLQLGSAT